MAIKFQQLSAARYLFDRESGDVYEERDGVTSVLAWKNGVKDRVPVTYVPPDLETLWCSDHKVWEFVTKRVEEE